MYPNSLITLIPQATLHQLSKKIPAPIYNNDTKKLSCIPVSRTIRCTTKCPHPLCTNSIRMCTHLHIYIAIHISVVTQRLRSRGYIASILGRIVSLGSLRSRLVFIARYSEFFFFFVFHVELRNFLRRSKRDSTRVLTITDAKCCGWCFYV